MKRNQKVLIIALAIILGLSVLVVISNRKQPIRQQISRQQAIPGGSVKMAPAADVYKPVVQSDQWKEAVPMEGPINTAGAEDSPFMSADDNWFFFFFTPDVKVPAEKQILDSVTGIWWSKRTSGQWSEPERIVLNDDLSLDGCEFLQGDTLWFCSVRKGNYREIDVYTAKYEDGRWTDWKNAGREFNAENAIGEFCFSPDGNTMYFGSAREGGYGGRDIWMRKKTDGGWGPPANLGSVVNSNLDEDQPFITRDGNELWFTGQSRLGYAGPAVYRSVKSAEGSWSKPEEVISNFAGEPTLDSEGNVYFVHHFFNKDRKMVEADIYVAYRSYLSPAQNNVGQPTIPMLDETIPLPAQTLTLRLWPQFSRPHRQESC